MKIYIIFNIITIFYLLALKIRTLHFQNYIENIIALMEQDILLNQIHQLKEPKNLKYIKKFITKINNIIVYLNQKHKLTQAFNSNVAHELKTPLSGLKINLEYLLSYNNTTLDENMMNKIKLAIKDINDLDSVISQMLLVSNNNIEALHTNMQRVLLNDVIYEVVCEKQDHLKGKDIHLNIKINQAVSLHGHQKLLRHAIANILDNAIKYSVNHQYISIVLKKKRRHIYFIIKDNGIGISKKELKLIFHPYYRGTNINSNIQGYGLGLSLASWIFELHSAKIRIRSTKGKGTMIFIKFYIV